MSNELIRELVEALEYAHDFLSMSASRYDDIEETLTKAKAYLETGGWTRVEDGLPEPCVPKNVCIEREHNGKRLVLRALYAAPKTLELSDEAEGGEYDEETDTYWCEEGWYESNDMDEIYWKISDRVVAWQDLPEPPKG